MARKGHLDPSVRLEQAAKTLKFNNLAIFILWPRVNKWFLRMNQFFLEAIDSCQKKEKDLPISSTMCGKSYGVVFQRAASAFFVLIFPIHFKLFLELFPGMFPSYHKCRPRQ
jgi:hypothetical protein